MPGENRYFWGSIYPESMIDNWQDEIAHIIQKPFAYCIHQSDSTAEHERKTHVHLIVAWSNNSTAKAALRLFNKLTAPGHACCCPHVEACENIRYCYDYLIHDTDDARKKGKHLYDPSERIEGNGFDIGSYEQLDISEKNRIIDYIENLIDEVPFTNVAELRSFIADNCEYKFLLVFRERHFYFGALCKGQYQRMECARKLNQRDRVQ